MTYSIRTLLLGLVSFPALAFADPTPPAVELQPWQVREKEFFATIKGVGQKQPDALKALDAVLTEFEQQQMHRTPLENMDILGLYYVRREGFAKALPVVAMNAVLGWYDCLRFDSQAGLKAVGNQQRFFFRALDLAGKERGQEAVQYLQTNREEAARAINQGIAWAEKYRDQDTYDHHWPTAFDAPNSPGGMPPEKWSFAWEDAKAQVRGFYIIPAKTSGPSVLQYSAEVRQQSKASDTLFHDMIAAPGGVGMSDQVFFPRAQARKLIKIEVVVPYVHEQAGTEIWTIEHAPGDQANYEVQFNPDGQGGTNFGVRKKP